MESASEPLHVLRVWFDAGSRLWRVCRWDDVGGIASAPVLFSGSPQMRSSGGRLVIEGAQLTAGTVISLEGQNASVDRITLARGNLTYRLWYDEAVGVWRIQQDGAGGVASSTVVVHDRFVSDGRFLRFEKSECKFGTDVWLQNADRSGPIVRVMPQSQFLALPVVASLTAESRRPRR